MAGKSLLVALPGLSPGQSTFPELVRSVPCTLTRRTAESPFPVLLSGQIQKNPWRKHSNTCDSRAFSCYSLLSFFCCHLRKCSNWKYSSLTLGAVWKYKCWYSWCLFYSNTFRSHRISTSLLLFRPKAEFELQISSEPEIPGFRQICLTYCVLEWKVRLFSLQTALLIILCPKVISASVKWSNKHSSVSSHFAQNGISKKSSEQGRVCKSRPISLLLFYFSLGWSATDLVSLVRVFFETKNMLLFILKRTFMQFGYSDFLVRATKLLQGAKFLFHGEIVSCSFC